MFVLGFSARDPRSGVPESREDGRSVSIFRDGFQQCPRCGVELVDARSARGCPQCRGMWIAEAVLTEMVLRMLPVPAPGSLRILALKKQDGRVPCPECHDPMGIAMLHGVVVDHCAKHGLWFDARELQSVLHGARPERLRLPAPERLNREPTMLRTREPTAPPPVPEDAPRAGVPRLRFTVSRGGATAVGEMRREIIKVGRLASAHVRLTDDSGSARMHAVIEANAVDDVTIIDLGSAIGTLVNGERINKTQLVTGDTIQIGDTSLELTILEP
jgi:Zn-finger nucleic acid-binding protein